MVSSVEKELDSLKSLVMRDVCVQGNYIQGEDKVNVAWQEGKSFKCSDRVISVLLISSQSHKRLTDTVQKVRNLFRSTEAS